MCSKVGNCEVTSQAVLPIAKSFIKRDGWTKGTNRCPWTFRNTISPERKSQRDYGLLGNQFTSHDLCDETHVRQVGSGVQDLLASIHGTPFGKVRPCDI
jgi:hypothetical protein